MGLPAHRQDCLVALASHHPSPIQLPAGTTTLAQHLLFEVIPLLIVLFRSVFDAYSTLTSLHYYVGGSWLFGPRHLEPLEASGTRRW